MEDASVALDDADDLGLSYPRGFYAVRGGNFPRAFWCRPWARLGGGATNVRAR
jgi:hypothetical protein